MDMYRRALLQKREKKEYAKRLLFISCERMKVETSLSSLARRVKEKKKQSLTTMRMKSS